MHSHIVAPSHLYLPTPTDVQVAEKRSKRMAEELRAINARQQAAKLQLIKEQAQAQALREAERMHQERELNATVWHALF